MMGVRRWAGLWILSLVVGLAAAFVLPASASATSAAPVRSAAPVQSPTPVQMNFACALKSNGLMAYVTSPTQCTSNETAVTIVPGPHFVCIHTDKSVFLVASLSSCPVPKNLAALTLPPSSAPVYFCASNGSGVLAYTTDPSLCNTSKQFPVVVPVPHTAPVLANIETSTLQYYAGTPPVPITSTLTVSSSDATTLASATVKISSGLVSADDSLGFTTQNGITGSYNSSTGVLTLTGTASLANYQAALRSVTYKDSNALTAAGTRTISFQVNDGFSANNLSNTVSRTVAVATNTPPTCSNVSASTDKNTAIDITVLSSCSDPDGDTLTVASVDTTGTKGSVSINANGTIHYDPNGQFQSLTQGQTATDTFTFKVSDGFQDSAGATVTVTINGVNDKPVISNVETTPLSYQAQSPPVAITSTLTISDADDSTMASATVSITAGFLSGADTLSFTNQNGITGSYNASTGVLTLTGNASIADYQAALRSVEFSTSDTSASPAARTVSFQVTDSVGAVSNTAQRTINVSAAAQPPTAVNQSYTAVGNTPLAVGTTVSGPAATVSGSLLNGDSGDASCGTLSVTGNTTPAHGTVTVNPDGTFTYLPGAGFSGTDTFQYTITCSKSSKTASATVTISVGTVVWYVDDSKAAAGNGEAGSPFNTLAAASSAAGTNSIIFLYQGNATYTGGLSMKSGQALYGQPHGLTVSGYNLVAAGGSNPTMTNSSGNGIDLASGADVEDVTVSGASADGINGSGVTGTVTIANSTITGSAVNNALITDTSGTLNLTVTGSTFSSNNATTGNYGLRVNANGATNATVSVTGSTFTDNASFDFEFSTDTSATGTNSVTFSNNTVTGGGGVLMGPFGNDTTTITIDGNNIQNPQVEGIGVDNTNQTDTGGKVSGTINGNTVGSPTVANSGGGDGINISAEGSFTETLAITNNKLYQYSNDAGINFIDRQGSPTMNLTITGNTIADPGKFGSWGLLGGAGAETGDAGQVCAAMSGNSMTGSAQAGQGGADFELDQGFATTFKLPGYGGGSGDTNAVVSFVQGNNTPSGGTAPSGIATVSGSGGGFVGGSGCPAP
jgi:VCBS repeat-containing protein